FMWNFAGRQNDIQGNGELEHGNWLTGIPFIDNARLGNQDLLPDELKENKGHNVFYCMPLILGLIGLFWQAWYTRKRKVTVNGTEKQIDDPIGIRQFWVVFFLFFMTGLAIVIYLNQTPMQPRERDYAYAGSFYAFAIWCGMGVAAIIDWLNRKMKKESLVLTILVSIISLGVPIQMASQTWDDHDRSGRYCCRDFGQNYLNSCQQEGNPIIYTNGDNDTFPLWYNMDVEGVRTDARVCNLSYLQTDWYIDQMRRPAYESPSVPISWDRIEYCSGTNEYVRIEPQMKQAVIEHYKQNPEMAREQFGDDPFELSNILKYWVRSKNDDLHIIPTDTIYMTIDPVAVRNSGMMLATDSIPEKMVISLKNKSALYKGDLMILEMLAGCNWTRPIYVAVSVGDDNYINLGDNTITEGLAYRLTPFTTSINGKPVPGVKNFDTQKTYDNIMHRFKFGGIDKKGIYLDETVMRMCYTHRRIMARLALELLSEGDEKKAEEVLRYTAKIIPVYNVAHNYSSGSLDMARAWATLGNKQEALKIINSLWRNSTQYMKWYCSLQGIRFESAKQDCLMHFYILQQVNALTEMVDQKLADQQMNELSLLGSFYEQKGGDLGY
ncbi:MAG: hypothetical protein IJS95_03585, partial [Prevotella sp.]|nr:hypothetical protein [Prevotella sp.]